MVDGDSDRRVFQAAEASALDRIQAGRVAISRWRNGGAPSPTQVGRILAHARAEYSLTPACEITVEGNPENFGARRLAHLCAVGVNRFSVGIQSFDDESTTLPDAGTRPRQPGRRSRPPSIRAGRSTWT